MPDQNTLFVENTLPTWAIEPKNWTGAASNGVWCSLKGAQMISVGIITGAWAAGTAAVTLQQATAVAGTGAKTLNYGLAYLWTSTSATGTLTRTAISSNTFNLDTANKLYVFDVPAISLDVANAFDCFRVQVASPGANNDFYGALYFFRHLRYPSGIGRETTVYAGIDPYTD